MHLGRYGLILVVVYLSTSTLIRGQAINNSRTNSDHQTLTLDRHSIGDHHHHDLITTASGKRMLPGGVDGSVTPELIPDSVAYSLFLSNVAEPLNGTPEQQHRERAKLDRAELSEPDILAMLLILDTFQKQQELLEDSFRSGVSPTTDVDPFRDQLVGITRDAMKTAVSAEGLANIDALIQREKRHMAIYPFPTSHD